MTSIPYPPRNSIIVFRESFPRKEYSGHSALKYYIKASVNGNHESEIRVSSKQQKDVIDYLIQVDLKLTNAVVRCDSYARFTVLKHSQDDFLDCQDLTNYL